MPDLIIRNLHASIGSAEILRASTSSFPGGGAIMGPNGSVSRRWRVLMGHPSYEVTEGEVVHG
jgi:Fe-S cluster assembly ATPase SufC